MAKDLKYYKDLSVQLEKEIEIYESSYVNFETAVDLTKRGSELTDEQRRIGNEFAIFCKDEGFSKDGRIRVSTYPDIKKNIVERVEFLKQQKEINDKMLALYEELDNLKNNNQISEEALKELKARAEKRYDVGTEAYNQELERIKKAYINKKVEKVNDAINESKEVVKNNKKEHGLAKVVSSVFGPVGNKVYNAYVTAHNWNIDLRKKKVLNLVVKLGASLGFLGLVSLAGLTGFPLVAGIGIGLTAMYKTVANTLRKVPDKLEKKENISSLKETWFRYRKSRGNGKISTDKKLYQGVDFSKYNQEVRTETPAEEINEPTKVENKTEEVKEPVKAETKNEEVKEPTKVENKVEEVKEPVKVETKTEEVKEPAKVETKAEEVKEPAKAETKTEEVKEPVKVENKTEKVKETAKEVSRNGKSKDIVPEKNSGTEVNSIADIIEVLKKFEVNNGITTIDDWYTYENVRKYLGNIISQNADEKYIELRGLFDEMAKHISPELRMRIQTVKTFENINDSNKRKSITTKVKEATNQYREQEYQRIINLIETADENQVVMGEVNQFLEHYRTGITTQQREYIGQLLQERETKVHEISGRGK